MSKRVAETLSGSYRQNVKDRTGAERLVKETHTIWNAARGKARQDLACKRAATACVQKVVGLETVFDEHQAHNSLRLCIFVPIARPCGLAQLPAAADAEG